MRLLKVYRPAGNSISLKRERFNNKQFSGYQFSFYQSGTAALSTAILACLKLKGVDNNLAEIVLPAYACPDLISAIIYAGAQPILIDLEKDSTYISLDQLKNSISYNTVAIIAINFLGISDRIEKFRDIIKIHDIFLIEDSAQWFPVSKIENNWSGDFNIISFGRGKPVNLLNGGAVITSNDDFYKALVEATPYPQNIISQLITLLKIGAYNLAIQPLIYGLVSRIPGLHLGETRYKPLDSVQSMNKLHSKIIQSNVDKYNRQKIIWPLIKAKLTAIKNQKIIDLVPDNEESDCTILLRYPLLVCDKTIRDQFYEQTRHLGTSRLYQQPLIQIAGLENILDKDLDYPNARDFADHLITLPTHEDINEKVIHQIFMILNQLLQES